jgi:hypothetical protein
MTRLVGGLEPHDLGTKMVSDGVNHDSSTSSRKNHGYSTEEFDGIKNSERVAWVLAGY